MRLITGQPQGWPYLQQPGGWQDLVRKIAKLSHFEQNDGRVSRLESGTCQVDVFFRKKKSNLISFVENTLDLATARFKTRNPPVVSLKSR